jgi:hypothetical protein
VRTARPVDAPILVPAPLVEDWLVILLPIQTYAVDMQPARMAQPGDWYRVALTMGDYALAMREDDANQQSVWIQMDGSSVRRIVVESSQRSHERLQLVTYDGAEAYSIFWEPVDLEGGEQFILLWADGDYALVGRQDDPELRLWIRLDAGVEIASL